MSAERLFAFLGALLGALAVIAGALGSHALKSRLTPEALTIFEIGARYHMFHALALCVVAWACTRWQGTALQLAGGLFVLGTLLFSGSLYLLAFVGSRPLAMITPVGGVALIVGWLCLAWAALTAQRRH